MSANIIDGKAYAANLRERISEHVKNLKNEHNITPGLAVIIVGHDPASQVYVRNKAKQTLEVGMNSFKYDLPENVSETELLTLINELNIRQDVHGILVQMPVPKHINATNIINALNPDKDVDMFHPINAGKLMVGQVGPVSCTPLGCLMMLRDVHGSLEGKEAVVIGRSNLVGKPMAQLLLRENCTVTMAHSRTIDLPAVV
ncbi:MAG: bifunctional methylenetetrahydrofolate dehydrogenase/methenyltetrahydrofolate cyclohydrolase, partial [Devosiaceae bacterium]|nr:bifunctional methylenetetrahydrofolate dehydrogenase/methenyltetrahydrofolate cyclohydrolase [Devosiaceae bacterium]